jgi:hypothetical protein
MLDQDKGEQAALKLTVNGGNPIGAAIASAVPFTPSGFEADDNGTVSFSDGTHAPVVVNITNGVLSATTANLSGFNDGTITATLSSQERTLRAILSPMWSQARLWIRIKSRKHRR